MKEVLKWDGKMVQYGQQILYLEVFNFHLFSLRNLLKKIENQIKSSDLSLVNEK